MDASLIREITIDRQQYTATKTDRGFQFHTYDIEVSYDFICAVTSEFGTSYVYISPNVDEFEEGYLTITVERPTRNNPFKS